MRSRAHRPRPCPEAARRTLVALAALASLAPVAGCDATPGAPALGTLEMALAPAVDDGPIVHATYDVAIDMVSDGGELVRHLTLSDMASDPGTGALTWVGTCAAGPNGAPRMGVATVWLKDIVVAGPSGLLAPQLPMVSVQPFECRTGEDVRLGFEFEVVLAAARGFADVTIAVDALACSTKFDCQDALLTGPDGVKGPTLVTAVSCRGRGDAATGTVDALIAFARRFRCYDAAGREVEAAPTSERVFTGAERDGTAYWNTAFLLDHEAMAGVDHCAIEASAFPRSQPIGGPRAGALLLGGSSIAWSIEARLSDDGHLACTGHVGPRMVAVRIDDAPTPSDSRVHPADAPVTLATTALIPTEKPRCRDAEAALGVATAEREALAATVAARAALEARAAACELADAALNGPEASVAIALDAAEAEVAGTPGGALDAAVASAVTEELAAARAAAGRARAALSDLEPALVAGLDDLDAALAALATEVAAGRFDATAHDAARGALAGLGEALAEALAAARLALAVGADGATLAMAMDAADEAVGRAGGTRDACLAEGDGALPGVAVWATGDVTFPAPEDVPAPSPVLDEFLPLGFDPGGHTSVELIAACDADPIGLRVELVASVADVRDAESERLVVVDLRRGDDGRWRCALDPRGRCLERELSDIACMRRE